MKKVIFAVMFVAAFAGVATAEEDPYARAGKAVAEAMAANHEFARRVDEFIKRFDERMKKQREKQMEEIQKEEKPR